MVMNKASDYYAPIQTVSRSSLYFCVIAAILISGCTPRYKYSTQDHASYLVKSNEAIIGVIDDNWICGKASLYPDTEYGRAALNNYIPQNEIDPQFNDLVIRDIEPSDGRYIFKGVSAGNYVLSTICDSNGEIWLDAREVVQASSILSIDALENLGGSGSLTVATKYGEFTYDNGEWSPPGINASLRKTVKTKVVVQKGDRLEITLP